MKCPNCNATLVMTDRNGVEIDYCPECRGVWLDRGELDKIIERSAQFPTSTNSSNKPYKEDYQHKTDHHKDEQYYKKKKRDSFLGDLFDF